MTIREALLAMGYSEQAPGKWLKPVGYQCFSYNEAKNEWVNWFKALDTKQPTRYETKMFYDDEQRHGTYLDQLKYFECWTKHAMHVDGSSRFELQAFDLYRRSQ